jgi:hypothetical protein
MNRFTAKFLVSEKEFGVTFGDLLKSIGVAAENLYTGSAP